MLQIIKINSWLLVSFLGIPGSEAKSFTDLKAYLDEEKAAWIVAQIEVDVLSRAVCDMKISADRFATQIPTLENKVKHLEDKVVDGLKEVRAWELCLECTNRANDDYQKQVTELTKKLQGKSPD
jgi:outer membrane murein-binding lipoprotein Lpp